MFTWAHLGLLIIFGVAAHSTGEDNKTAVCPQNSFVAGYPPIFEDVAVDYYFGKTLVIFRTLKLNWMLAHLKCKKHGMRLVTFDSFEEYSFQAALLKRHLVSPVNFSWAWIGASDILNEGKFTYLETGKPFSTFYKATNQPDNAGGIEHCVEFRGNDLLFINDQPCDRSNGVFCEA